jgi:uncharacterized integral membrane protein
MRLGRRRQMIFKIGVRRDYPQAVEAVILQSEGLRSKDRTAAGEENFTLTQSPTSNTRTRNLKIGSMVAALVILVLFIALNFQSIEVEFLIFQASIRLAFALILTAVLGFIIGLASAHIRFK